jgi:hypothetical protein
VTWILPSFIFKEVSCPLLVMDLHRILTTRRRATAQSGLRACEEMSDNPFEDRVVIARGVVDRQGWPTTDREAR